MLKIDVHVRTGCKNVTARRLIQTDIQENLDIGRKKEGNVCGRIRKLGNHLEDMLDGEVMGGT